jgi:putative ABC transport system substrate-binding protein
MEARAQQRVRRLGILVHGSRSGPVWQQRLAAFRQGLEDLGWQEGRNIHIETVFSDNDFVRLPRVARELVVLGPEVIFANTTPATKALQTETRTIPIIFVQVSDPTGAGVVASLAHPGGNTTGLLLYEDSIAGKWLGMLKEIEPRLTRAAVIGNPRGFPFGYFLRIAKAIAPSLGIEIVPAPIANIEDLDRSISSFARISNGGLLVPPDNTVEEHRDVVIALVARHRLPTVYSTREFVVDGGLMSYSTNVVHHFRQAASYVDRVLRGANPADLPVETPTKYETVLNLKTAKALGFEVSPTMLVRADEVIE